MVSEGANMRPIIDQLNQINHAAIELSQQVVVIAAFLNKGNNNAEQQIYFAEELSKALDKFNVVMWPEDDNDNG